jgi:hypothetical protein
MKSPFPYFGGKSRVAADIWAALGDVPNYIEPFAGSCAVLLARPHAPATETINDKDCMVANFWRALANAPDDVAMHADWPVNEVDLEARHFWLVSHKADIRDALGDPEWFDARAAGWWVWGISCWIGGGWCDGKGPWHYNGERWSQAAGMGVHRQPPHLSDGMGVHRKRPHLSAGMGVHRKPSIYDYLGDIAARIRNVRVCCGDWKRICGPSPTYLRGVTGVFLDPPYSNDERAGRLYAEDCGNVARDVTAWALDAGKRPDMRIVVAGYDTEHTALEEAGWRVYDWKANGGYGAGRGKRGNINRYRERLWLSPACLDPTQMQLFSDRPADEPRVEVDE